MKTNVRTLEDLKTGKTIIAKLSKIISVDDEAHGGYPYTVYVFESTDNEKYMNFNNSNVVKSYRFNPGWILSDVWPIEQKGGKKQRKKQRIYRITDLSW